MDPQILNACNVLYSDPVEIATHIATNMCEAAQCQAGVGHGLRKVPFEIALAPGASISVEVNFSRESYVWGVVVYQGHADFDRQLWDISDIQSTAQMQSWEIYGNRSTFGTSGAQPFNANTDPLPLELFFEAGDDDLSNLIHQRNFLPPLVSNTNVGDGNSSIVYTLTLDAAAPTAQTAYGWHYVYFPKQKKNGKKG